MGETIRFGVSMDSDLVELLDRLTREGNHDNRSETLRTLVRNEVITRGIEDTDREVIGTMTLLYHHKTHLPRVSIAPYPSVSIKANFLFHVEGEICAKILIIKGTGREVQAWASKLLNSTNIIGKLSFTATDELYRELVKS